MDEALSLYKTVNPIRQFMEQKDFLGFTPLHYVHSIRIAHFYITRGANPKAQGFLKKTVLHEFVTRRS